MDKLKLKKLNSYIFYNNFDKNIENDINFDLPKYLEEAAIESVTEQEETGNLCSEQGTDVVTKEIHLVDENKHIMKSDRSTKKRRKKSKHSMFLRFIPEMRFFIKIINSLSVIKRKNYFEHFV